MSREAWVIGAMASGMAIAMGVSLPLAHGQAHAPTIGFGEIREGMKGYGLTVFRGTEPERFDVEAIGVLHNFRPGQDLLLVKTPHPRLNITKNVKGMSGSPIYFDGRLAGAYAYSLASFQTEPVAGITPISPMLAELARPIPPGFWPLEGGAPLPEGGKPRAPSPAPRGPTAWNGPPGQYDVLSHARQIEAQLGRDGRGWIAAATPIMLGGVGDKTAGFVRDLLTPLGLEPLQAGGNGGRAPEADAPRNYVDGGALTVELTRGDVSFTGMGTVTHVQGDRLCAFGHPMMGAGDTAMPTGIGRVLWIYASDNHSFKVGETARSLGTLVQDRQSAVIADARKRPPMFPMNVEVRGAEGAPKKSWKVEVTEEKFMSPGLGAAVLGSVVEATVSERRDVTWQLRSKLAIAGHGTLELEDFGVSIGGTPDSGDWAHARIVKALGDVLNNPWEQVRIERIDAELSVQFARDLLRLRGVDALESEVDAGGRARLALHLVPFAGPEVVRTIEVVIAPELAGKEVELEVLPGYDVSPELAAPESLPQLLANELQQSATPRSAVVQYRVPSQGVTYRGHVASRLPDFALDALRPAYSNTGPEAFLSYVRTVVPLDRYIEGKDKVKIKVRSLLR